MSFQQKKLIIAGIAVVAILLSSSPASAQGVMFVTGGKVGIGTNTPAEILDIVDTSGANLAMQLTQSGSNTWRYTLAAGPVPGGKTDVFRISKGGTGGPEFEVASRLDAGGIPTLEVFGSIKATNVVFSSSRALKTDVAPLDGSDVLNRLADLPVTQWRYKHENADTFHYGPMAEDFHEVFGLPGSTASISVVDANGIALAAIKGLAEQNAELLERVAALEALIEQQ